MATKVKLIADGVITPDQITLTTASTGTNTTAPATTAFVQQEITALVDSSPDALNTLNELAAALGDDANFSTTVTNSIATKLPLAGGTLTGNLNFGDNNKAVFGAGSDLQIYHDGTSSYIINTTNDLVIQDDSRVRFRTPSLMVNNAANTENMLIATEDGSVDLYYNSQKKFETTDTGINVTGTAVTTNLTIDDGVIEFDKPSVYGFRFLQNDAGNDLSIQQGDANNANYVTRLNIDSSGKVGIGCTPDAKLTVNGAANSEQVIITGNNNQSRGLSILTAATGGQQDATVIFNAQDTENVAYPAMKFQAGGGDILRFHHQSIINNARVGLAYPCELMFNGEYTAGQQDVALEAGHAARIEFLKDDFFRIQGSASVSAGAVISYADKLKVNIDSGGILFGSDTAAANTLDDYEEGTWTPGFGGASLSTATGHYTKIGNQVTVHYHIVLSGGMPTSSAPVRISGLPFTIDSNGAGSIYARYYTPNDSTLTTILVDGDSFIRLININEQNFDYTVYGELEASHNNSADVRGTATYKV